MNSKYKILSGIPNYKLFRSFGYPEMLPLNITASVTYRCNSRCKTCNVWRKKADELSVDEYDCTFKNIGRQPYWFTISGGEPFLRDDLIDICGSIYDNCRPGIINIPTNGILYEKIPEMVEEIAEVCPETQIIINVSLDGIGKDHDEIRGIKNNYEKTIRTYTELRQLKYLNLKLGIHTVISKFNVNKIPQIYEHVQTLKPDSYITEIAEERMELGTIGSGITPDLKEYSAAVDYLSDKMNGWKSQGVSRVTKHFRLQYYDLVKETLRYKTQIIPCYAGFASAHIAPDGDVWTCCIKAESIGNLRETGYNFSDIWFGEKAKEARRSIKSKSCYCPLANASYTNMFHDFGTLTGIGLKMIV